MGASILDQWLELFGFEGNPFAFEEAGIEDRNGLLNIVFVEPPNFYEIMGSAWRPQSAMIFAPPGSGKTAQCRMLDYYCRNHLTDGYIFSIRYDKFDRILERPDVARDIHRITLCHHVHEIFAQSIPRLADFLHSNQILLRIFEQMKPKKRIYLGWLLSNYLPEGNGYDLREFLNSSFWHRDVLQDFTAKLARSPAQLLDDFYSLLSDFGFEAIYVLVDQVDELPETANEPSAAVALFAPLIEMLALVSNGHMAVKFYLPESLSPLLESHLDKDYLISYNLSWENHVLLDILHTRLSAYSHHPSLDAVCVPKLRGHIEQDMVEIASGSPRRLIRLGELLLSEHCKSPIPRQESEWLITESAWRAARGRFVAKEMQLSMLQQPMASQVKVYTAKYVEDLILQGESDVVEFKSTMRWNLYQNKRDRAMDKVIAKTLSGFMNANGGTLVIGIADDGEVLGLAPDFSTLHKKDEDGFQLALRDIVQTYLGLMFYEYVQPHFVELTGKTVCIVEIRRSDKPVYLNDKDKQEFWVRVGNSTCLLKIQEVVEYIHLTWNEKG